MQHCAWVEEPLQVRNLDCSPGFNLASLLVEVYFIGVEDNCACTVLNCAWAGGNANRHPNLSVTS